LVNQLPPDILPKTAQITLSEKESSNSNAKKRNSDGMMVDGVK